MKKKVILVPGNTDLNRGDQALVWESIKVIKEVYDNPEVILMKGNDYRQYAQTERLGYQMINVILKHPARIFSKRQHIRYSLLDIVLIGLVAVFDLIGSSLLLVRCRLVNKFGLFFMSDSSEETFNAFRTCDTVFVKGGGFIHSYGAITDAYQMYYLLYYILLAIRHKKEIVILPNSIGPLKSKLAGWLADYAMNHCTYLSVRESVSEQFLDSRESLKVPIYRHADLGYFLSSDSIFNTDAYLREKGIDTSKPMIVITLRPYRFPGEAEPEKKYEQYILSFVSLSQYLFEKNYQVVLFSHTLGPSAHENDTIAVKDVSTLLDRQGVKHVCIEDFDLDCRQVMAIYSRFEFLIGTRFHSVIFAQNSFVPTIAITYGGNKGIGIMSDSGLAEYSIPMEDVTSAALKQIMDELLANKNIVVERLKNKRRDFENDRRKLIDEIKSKVL